MALNRVGLDVWVCVCACVGGGGGLDAGQLLGLFAPIYYSQQIKNLTASRKPVCLSSMRMCRKQVTKLQTKVTVRT